MFKLGNLLYRITAIERDRLEDGTEFIQIVGVCDNSPNVFLNEISLEGVYKRPDSKVKNITMPLEEASLFVAETCDFNGISKIEEDESIHINGTSNVHWDETMDKDVRVDIQI